MKKPTTIDYTILTSLVNDVLAPQTYFPNDVYVEPITTIDQKAKKGYAARADAQIKYGNNTIATMPIIVLRPGNGTGAQSALCRQARSVSWASGIRRKNAYLPRRKGGLFEVCLPIMGLTEHNIPIYDEMQLEELTLRNRTVVPGWQLEMDDSQSGLERVTKTYDVIGDNPFGNIHAIRNVTNNTYIVGFIEFKDRKSDLARHFIGVKNPKK